MKRKHFLWKYKHILAILYLPIYLIWFISLEETQAPKYTYMHCFIDDLIPFNEFFIIPYFLWFVYVAATLIFLFFQLDHLEDYHRCILALVLGMTTALIIYALFPNAQNMRPTTFSRDNIFTRIISFLYKTDTDTNVCPSVHVYNSIAIHMAIVKSHYFENRKKWKLASLTLCVLICLSTMFLKQHSFLDVIAAFGMYFVYYVLIYQPYKKYVPSKSAIRSTEG